MNILYIGNVYSEHLIPTYQKNCKHGYQFAAQALQSSIIQGLLQNSTSPYVLTIPSLPTFPTGYRMPILKPDKFVFNNKEIGCTSGIFNIPIIKFKFGYKSKIDKWFHVTEGKKYVLIYSLSATLFQIVRYIKTRYPDVIIGVIVADLPEFMSWNKYYTRLGLKKRDENLIYTNLHYIDKFILLSKHMAYKLPISNKPWIVMEGIFNPDSDTEVNNASIKQSKARAILYSGNLDNRYGIMDAVKAFTLIPDKDILFWICGFGDSENDIKEFAKKDKRIIYMRTLPRKEVLKLQKQASILLNPRHSSEEFTKYSFPSKTMEYLASETPTLMCKLESIPSEYNDHLFFIEDETVEGYRKALQFLLDSDKHYLESFGKEAGQFILANKTPVIQTKKIIDFLIN